MDCRCHDNPESSVGGLAASCERAVYAEPIMEDGFGHRGALLLDLFPHTCMDSGSSVVPTHSAVWYPTAMTRLSKTSGPRQTRLSVLRSSLCLPAVH